MSAEPFASSIHTTLPVAVAARNSPPPSRPAPQFRSRETCASILAKNLVVARVVAGLTQQKLAHRARISRATIAQIETGCGDPRLSTVAELAKALNVSPVLLLLGLSEVQALSAIHEGAIRSPVTIQPEKLQRMRDYVESGMLKDRLRAAKLGAAVVRGTSSASSSAVVTAALCSPIIPGEGTRLGATLGQLMSQYSQTS
jgi:transcriptional regulator with XRE-family HTH domain